MFFHSTLLRTLILAPILALWCAIWASVATAHEFWIAPEAFQVAPGDPVVARLINGEDFDGVSLAYFDRRIARFDLIHRGKTAPVVARMGDNPALDLPAPAPGLLVVVHETTPSFVTYKSWEKFQTFADHKAFDSWRAEHTRRGYDAPPFKERYTRHAKALIAIGDGAGQDAAQGLKTEFVALTNPYDPGFDGQMKVQVLLDGAPRAGAQVEAFAAKTGDQGDDSVTISLYQTNAKGIATVPVASGHRYLFDAVTLQPIEDPTDAVWDTFWAALTFAVP